MNHQFSDVIRLIQQSRENAVRAVNAELINLYWNIGEYISKRIENSEWGDSVISQLAAFIVQHHPELKGFSDKNLWRMRQFYEVYKDYSNLSTALREISWSHNLAIFSRCKSIEEREFYLKLTKKERYSIRELQRQISSSIYERSLTQINNLQLSTALRESSTDLSTTFKDNYVFEFLNLSEFHNENDLQKSIVKQIKDFILELGKDFIFMGEEFKIEVGNSDFYIDLLFYHRGLQCLVAFELKTDKFKPEYLGQLNFYLEALDRNVKKVNENPSIGILLCKDKDFEVVEYALHRSLSPTLVAEYSLQLPDKRLLQQKLQELYERNDL